MKNDPTKIHETVIKDIIDIVSDLKDSDEIDMINRRKSGVGNYTSIARASSNMTLVFPMCCSRSLDIHSAAMAAKAQERKCVTMLQMVLSAHSISDAKSGEEYIRQFHTNLKLGDMSVDDFIEFMDDHVEESADIIPINVWNNLKKDLRNINYTFAESCSKLALSDYTVYTEAPKGKTNGSGKNNNGSRNRNGNNGSRNKIQNNSNFRVRQRPNSNNNGNNNSNNNGNNSGGGNNTINKQTDQKNNIDAAKTTVEYFDKQLQASDVKKANELVPSMMIVRVINKDGIANVFYIGVKVKIVPIDSNDIINHIMLKYKDNNNLIKLIQATTRETSFIRDFVFAIDKAKMDALSQSRRGSANKIWKILERMAVKSKIRRGFSMKNDASMITTLTVSKEEVEYLKKYANIDIEKPDVIIPIMNSYNLMSVIIIDESLEIASFIYDTGDDMYEQLPFDSLESSNAGGDIYKKVVNIMSRMR